MYDPKKEGSIKVPIILGKVSLNYPSATQRKVEEHIHILLLLDFCLSANARVYSKFISGCNSLTVLIECFFESSQMYEKSHANVLHAK